jgi:hypothetical protein
MGISGVENDHEGAGEQAINRAASGVNNAWRRRRACAYHGSRAETAYALARAATPRRDTACGAYDATITRHIACRRRSYFSVLLPAVRCMRLFAACCALRPAYDAHLLLFTAAPAGGVPRCRSADGMRQRGDDGWTLNAWYLPFARNVSRQHLYVR